MYTCIMYTYNTSIHILCVYVYTCIHIIHVYIQYIQYMLCYVYGSASNTLDQSEAKHFYLAIHSDIFYEDIHVWQEKCVHEDYYLTSTTPSLY